MPSIAEVFLRLRVDQSQVKNDVDQGLDRVDTSGAGAKAGKQFGKTMGQEGSKGATDVLRGADWATPGRQGGSRAGAGFLAAFRAVLPGVTKETEQAGQQGGENMAEAARNVLFSPAGLAGIVGAALATAPGLFAAAGAAGAVALGAAFAIKGSEALQAQGKVLIHDLGTTMTQASSVMIRPISQAMGLLAGELPTLRNLLSTTFTNAVPFVRPMVQMLVDLVNNTLPGFNYLLHAAQVPLSQFFNVAGRIVGTGLGNFFRALAPGLQPSLSALTSLLSIISSMLPMIASLSVQMAQLASPVLAGLAQALQVLPQMIGGVVKQLGDMGQKLNIPAAHDTMLDVLSNGLNWLQAHIPAGNKTILDLASGTNHANTALGGTGTRMQQLALRAAQAAPKVGTLRGDMALLNSTTANASIQLQAYNNMWNIIIGRHLAQQSAILADKAAFDNLRSSIRTTGAQSTASQQAFVAFIQQVGTSIGTLMQNGASVRTINAAYLDSIHKLQSLHGLNAEQRGDVAAVIRDYTAWTHTTDGLNAAIVTASRNIASQFIAHLVTIHHDSPAVNADTNNFADAILKTGTRSSQTASARRQLIADIVKAGGSAQQARQMVDDLQRSITGLHGKTATVKVDLAGMGGLKTVTTGNLPSVAKANQLILSGRAEGGPITGRGGPKEDNIPIWASNGEFVMQTAAVRKYGLPFMHALNAQKFATGGQIGADLNTAINWTQYHGDEWVQVVAAQFAQAVLDAQSGSVFGANVPNVGSGVARWTADVDKALSMLHLPWILARNVLVQMQSESGGNPNAVNLWDSNARAGHPSQGLMQVIPSTFQAYHVAGTSWNIRDPLANIAAAINYARHVYGPTLMRGGMGMGSGHGYANGGPITEPIFGIGASGQQYTFGEAGLEQVSSQADMKAMIAELRALRAELPARTAAGVAKAINGRKGMEAQNARLGSR